MLEIKTCEPDSPCSWVGDETPAVFAVYDGANNLATFAERADAELFVRAKAWASHWQEKGIGNPADYLTQPRQWIPCGDTQTFEAFRSACESNCPPWTPDEADPLMEKSRQMGMATNLVGQMLEATDAFRISMYNDSIFINGTRLADPQPQPVQIMDNVLCRPLDPMEPVQPDVVIEPRVESFVVLGPLSSLKPDIVARCPGCGWPLKEKIEDGCVPGNCSQRPIPNRAAMYEPE